MWRFRRRRDEELDAEIRAHLEMAERDRIERGEPPDVARASVRREFGNIALVKDATRSVWGGTSVERLLQDLRFGIRLLRRTPGFTIVAVLCLGLGVGVTTTVFSAINGLLLNPLPYADADRLVVVHTINVKRDTGDNGFISWADFRSWHAQTRAIDEFGVWTRGPVDLYVPGAEPENLGAAA